MSYRPIYYILLFVLILCLSAPGPVGAQTAGGDSEPAAGPQQASAALSPGRGPSVTYTDERSALGDEMPPKRLPLAPKSLGLRLVGTVVGDDSEMSLAVIENETARRQRAYREGSSAGRVLIKQIQRNEVIIDAGRGDEVLTMLHGQALGSQQAPQEEVRGQPIPQHAGRSQLAGARHQTFQLDREEVASALRDVDQVMREVRLSPYTVYDRPAGLSITNIAPGSILSKMGLRNGDVIKSVDDEAITGPQQVAEFLKRLREGGEVSIWVKGRRRSRRIDVKIE